MCDSIDNISNKLIYIIKSLCSTNAIWWHNYVSILAMAMAATDISWMNIDLSPNVVCVIDIWMPQTAFDDVNIYSQMLVAVNKGLAVYLTKWVEYIFYICTSILSGKSTSYYNMCIYNDASGDAIKWKLYGPYLICAWTTCWTIETPVPWDAIAPIMTSL